MSMKKGVSSNREKLFAKEKKMTGAIIDVLGRKLGIIKRDLFAK